MKSQKCTGEVCSVQDTKRLMTCFKDVRGSYFLFRHKGDTQVQLQVEKLCHVHLLPLFVGLFVFLGRTWFAWCKGYPRGTRTQRGPWTTWSPCEYSRALWDISNHKALVLYFFLPSIEISHVYFSPVRFPVVH